MEAVSAISDTEEDKETGDTEQHTTERGDNGVSERSIKCDTAPKAA